MGLKMKAEKRIVRPSTVMVYLDNEIKEITECEPNYEYHKEGDCSITYFKDKGGKRVDVQAVKDNVIKYMRSNKIVGKDDVVGCNIIPSHFFTRGDEEGLRHSDYSFKMNIIVRAKTK